MSLYRCAVCGSPNVVKIEKNDGFSYSKALAGTVVFGTVCAVAGINGKKSYAYSCPDCGTTLPQPMDSITKEKIDLVMTNPEVLVPVLYPDIYNKYPYLQKNRDLARARKLDEATSSINCSNPLNISEEDFRHAAKVFYNAALPMSIIATSKIEEVRLKAKEYIDVISEALHCISTIMFGIYAYPYLVITEMLPSKSPIYETGLHKYNLRKAFLSYILIENGGKMTYESVEFSIMDNPIYKKIFMTIYGNEYKSQKSSLSYFCKNEKELLEKTNEEIIIRFIRDVCLGSFFKRYGDYRLPLNRREVQLPFKLVNESLYILNPEFAGEEHLMVNRMVETEKKIEQLKNNITAPNSSMPTQTEINAQTSIDELQRSNTEINDQITKLHKKIFGKKKAAVEIQELEEKKKANQKKISELNNVIEKAKQKRAMEIRKKKSAIEEQLSKANHALEEIKKQKSEHIQQCPEWICLAEPDAENQ